MTVSPRDLAIEVARDAGRILRDRYGHVQQIKYKGEVDIVTDVDEMSERLIVERIQQHFPNHQILGEESGSTNSPNSSSGYRWIIDPLDGTTNFAHGYPFFCVSIGFEVDGEFRLGVVYAPVFDELFLAERGQGAFLNGRRMSVSKTDRLIRSLMSTGFNPDRDLARENFKHWGNLTFRTQALRRDGSAALNLCFVAAGRFDAYWEIGLKPWDLAAGSLMIREAGGSVTNFAGDDHRLADRALVSSNGLLHSALLDVLNEPD